MKTCKKIQKIIVFICEWYIMIVQSEVKTYVT